MDDKITLNDTVALMRDLRKRCDWDAAQTHESLRPYLIEESLELDEAIRDGNSPLMREELGDVLLQVLFHSTIAEERGEFDVDDVARGLITKMKGRHPHLYGDGVKEPWEKMKSKKRDSIADGLPASLPPLHRAHRLQDRAAGVGFDWPDTAGPAAKVEEELAEVARPPEPEPGRGECILVVDDEKPILAMVKATLEAHNYRVLAANGGTEAIALFHQLRSTIRLVLIDMMMPELDGPVVMAAIRNESADIQVVAASGLRPTGRYADSIVSANARFLPKPYSDDDLLTTIANLLNRPPVS